MLTAFSCGLCEAGTTQSLLRTATAVLVLPNAPHLSVSDGGHLLVATVRHVASRADYSLAEVREVHQLTVAAARALLVLGWADWINFQENGNWSVDTPAGPHSHTHVYGRSKSSTTQSFGEPLRLPTRMELASRPAAGLSIRELADLEAALAEQCLTT